MVADAALAEVTAADLLLVPGGPGTEAVLTDPQVLDWVRRWTREHLDHLGLLGLADPGRGRSADRAGGRPRTGPATRWLARFGAVPAEERVVFDGKYATAAGVSAGIDLGLHLAGLIAGDAVAQAIQLITEYDPHRRTGPAPWPPRRRRWWPRSGLQDRGGSGADRPGLAVGGRRPA
ncbi:hypothetical protein GCM10020229_39400 [Kitasatospora albolonga]